MDTAQVAADAETALTPRMTSAPSAMARLLTSCMGSEARVTKGSASTYAVFFVWAVADEHPRSWLLCHHYG